MNDSIENPWLALRGSPYLLDGDRDLINSHNLKYKEDDRIKFQLESLPIPYIGNPKSKVYLLLLNPGHAPEDLNVQSNDVYKNLWNKNIRHDENFYYINKTLPMCPGKKYWLGKLRQLIENCGHENVEGGVFLIQYIAYHSINFKSISSHLHSQFYARKLTINAIAEGKIIVVMRSLKLWLSLIPELSNYKNVISCTNPRNPNISSKQLGKFYNEILDIIKSK